MQSRSKWMECAGRHHSEIQKAASELDYKEQIELTYTVTSEKKQLIDALISVIMKHNKNYYYHLFSRNCQHFVIDALKVEQPDCFHW